MRLKPLCLAFALGLYSAGTAHAGEPPRKSWRLNSLRKR